MNRVSETPYGERGGQDKGFQSQMSDFSDKATDMAHQAADAAGEMKDKAVQAGSEAIEMVDEWLKPVGLSLKEKPVMTLAVVAGAALAVGMMMKQSQSRSQWDEMVNRVTDLARRSRWA